MTWNIALSPVRTDSPPVYAVAGDVLTVDGEPFDFAPLAEGGTLPRAALGDGDGPPRWLLSPVERQGGVLRLTVLLGLGPHASEAARFPAPVVVDADGPVPLPDAGYPEMES